MSDRRQAIVELLMGQPTRLGQPFPGTITPLPQPRPQAAIAQDMLGRGEIDSSTAGDMAGNFAKLPPDHPERLIRINEMLRSGQINPEEYRLYMQSIGR